MNTLIKSTMDKITPLDKATMETVQNRQNSLAKPLNSLGDLEKIITQIAGITGNPIPKIQNKAVVVMCADNGLAEEQLFAVPQEVTHCLVKGLLANCMGVNTLANTVGADVVVVDVGVKGEITHPNLIDKKIANGTKNFTKGAAMTYKQAINSIEIGIEIAKSMKAEGYDILATGEVGLGNTSTSSAIASIYTGLSVSEVVGYGAGIAEGKGISDKVAMIERAITVNNPDPLDPIDVLSKVGGFDIGAMAGLILGCAAEKMPIVLDGFISTAAAIIAAKICPACVDYMIASHCSKEPGAIKIAEQLNITPYLNLNMCLGEGSGAALMFGIIDGAYNVYTQMGTLGMICSL